MTEAISIFFSAWSEADAGNRQTLVAGSVADKASYADPRTPAPIHGAAAISEYIGGFVQAAPGAAAEVVDTQTQNGLTRATIAFRMPGGNAQMGQYFIELDAAGKIRAMTGFVGTGAPE